MQSLIGRCFKVSIENVEQLRTVNTVERNCLYEKDGKYYRVLSIFKNHITNGDMSGLEIKTKK